MNRRVSREPLEGHRVVEELPVSLLRLVEGLHVLDLRDGLLDGVTLPGLIGDHLRDPVRLARLEAQDPAHVSNDGAALHRSEGDDLADRVPAVLLPHVLDHLSPPLEAEVDVDIRHRDPFGVQEALEEELVLDGVQVGDAQAVGHE